MNLSTSRYAEKKQTQEEIKRQIALLQARLEPEPELHTGPLVPKQKSIQSVTLATATPSPSQYDISQLYPMLTYLKPEKKRKLERAQCYGSTTFKTCFSNSIQPKVNQF